MLIYHMLPAGEWRGLPAGAAYRAASLESEGFIHCSGSHSTLLNVGNSFYRNEPGAWLILVIDEEAVEPPVRWDPVGEAHFPHIYGPLNRSAVIEIVDFPRTADGAFELPRAWSGAE